MIEPDFGACEGAFCYLIFASNDANVRREREVPHLLHIWEMWADAIFGYGIGSQVTHVPR